MLHPKVGMRIRLLPGKEQYIGKQFLLHFPTREATISEVRASYSTDYVIVLSCSRSETHLCAWYFGNLRGEPSFEVVDDAVILEEMKPDPFFAKA